MKSGRTEKLAEQAISDVLRVVPFVTDTEIEALPESDSGIDLRVVVRVGRDVQRLVCAVTSNGQPRIVRALVNQLRVLRQQEGADAYPVVLAPFISERSAEVCEDAGVGYVDFAGNCLLNFGTVHIRERGRENPFKSDRKLKSIYQPKSSRILRVLLSAPSKRWRVEPLAAEANVSLGLVSDVRRQLLDSEWTDTDGDGLFLKEPEALLMDWVRNYDSRKNTTVECYSMLPLPELEGAIAEVCTGRGIRYALAGFSAGARLAPNVRYNRAAAFVDENALDIAGELEAKQVTSGANLLLLTPYDEGVFYDSRVVEDVCVTSPVQTYLDLRQLSGRGSEAAEAVLEQVIRPQW